MAKKAKTKKRQPKITIKFNKSYWDKLAEAECGDGLCEIKLK